MLAVGTVSRTHEMLVTLEQDGLSFRVLSAPHFLDPIASCDSDMTISEAELDLAITKKLKRSNQCYVRSLGRKLSVRTFVPPSLLGIL